ncbi:alpha/beta hydrolase [Aporhodopirellula aestuarii]|uniref:Alpha/beta hydrolase n=1 Tax=Aporhodopirellula aestuarii TaxID=2950107 RepID=A0ABT0UEG8_9BACT|nr:alpha/beta hydrolase [Aporhodopirellula aestuarii]MCM2375269.1 alpha/beta hydrolase [Aporhodopirellula aestuarii]
MEKQMIASGAKVKTYKITTDSKGEAVELKMYLFEPADHKATDRRPAIVFFFGGGWNGGKPSQFAEHCKYLASRGMMAMTADYRVKSRQGTKAIACVSDGKSAVRWIRANSKELGVAPDKIVASGGSAGGHVAACTGVIKKYDESAEDQNVSSVPNALVLFNPALVLAPLEGHPVVNEEKLKSLKNRVGEDPKNISPVHHVAAGAPPTIIFHGKADTTVPYSTAEAFTKAMEEAENQCQLVGYEQQGHGFFNHKNKKGKFDETVAEMDRFLASLGYLKEREAK